MLVVKISSRDDRSINTSEGQWNVRAPRQNGCAQRARWAVQVGLAPFIAEVWEEFSHVKTNFR